jgi:Asp-tRNA(Asn)/Glu-tRNA(Gln) amidotransferase B subunit
LTLPGSNRFRASLPELPEAKMRRFMEQYELTPQEARLIDF